MLSYREAEIPKTFMLLWSLETIIGILAFISSSPHVIYRNILYLANLSIMTNLTLGTYLSEKQNPQLTKYGNIFLPPPPPGTFVIIK